MATSCKPVPERFASQRRFIDANSDFRDEFDKRSFAFRHRLGNHPGFALRRLIFFNAKTNPGAPGGFYCDAGTKSPKQREDNTPKPEFSAADAIQRIENCGAWIVLKRADKNPEYEALLRECMAELQKLTGLNLD